MPIRSIWNMRVVVTSAFLLLGLFVTGLATGLAGSAQPGTFTLTGSMNTARYNHRATLLPSGEVLVTGGLGVNGAYASLASAELYDPKKGRWTLTGSMNAGRTAFTATLLQNGEVLVAGGTDYEVTCYATAELYNPSTGQWTLTGSMTQPRCLHSATLLPDGEVLVSGGVNGIYSTNNTATVSGAEIYNPETGNWTATGSLNVSRAEAATLLLDDGEVLSTGGYNNTGNNAQSTDLTSAELYDPSTHAWTFTSSVSGTVGLPDAPALLTNGDMLIANYAQFYIQGSATWSATGPLPTIATPPTKTVALGNGNVLGTGCGCKSTNKFYTCNSPVNVTELYSFSGNTWSQTGSMNNARVSHTMTLLSSGEVLVAGGYNHPPQGVMTVLGSAELYTP